jgi:peptidoglycan/LPS O-acetylase OafA/YrhL
MIKRSAKASWYRPEVDGLRSIAVCAVIAHHLYSGLLPSGFLGVDIFFVISGYVITRSLNERDHAGLGDLLVEFYARRVKRILPALVACVLVTAFLGALVINPRVIEYASSMSAGFFALLGASNIYFFEKATDYFGASAPLNLFTQTWSLGVEEQFYLVFPLLLWVIGVSTRRPDSRHGLLLTLFGLTLLSLVAFVWLNLKPDNGAYFLMPPRFWELSLGCMIAVLPRGEHFLKGPRAIWPWSATALLIAALFSPQELQLYSMVVAVVASGLLIMSLEAGHPIHMWLASRWMVGIGLLSYSLYLWHWSVLALSRWTIGIHPWSAPFQLLAMFGLAALSYVFVERPLRRANWSRFRLATIGYGLTAAGCAAGVVLFLKFGADGKLYTGAPVQMAAKGVNTLFEGKRYDGTVQWRARDCVLSSDEDVGKQIDLDKCVLGVPSHPQAPRFLVVGNSYSAAELEMYAVLSDMGRGSVIITSSWGASPTPSLPNKPEWSKANAYYWKEVVPNLIAQLRKGDVLVMVNDLLDLTPAVRTAESRAGIELLKADLMALARQLDQKGLKIIFQSGTPFLREAQCPPDAAVVQWFNFGNTACVYYSKQYTLDRLAPLNDTLSEVERKNSNFYVYDFLSSLCPEKICSYQNAQGVFLYRDVFGHPSIEGSALGRQAFLSVAERALGSVGTEPQMSHNPQGDQADRHAPALANDPQGEFSKDQPP